MAFGCGAKAAKIILCIVNLCFLLSGLLLLGAGITLITDADIGDYVDFIATDESHLFRNAAILLIAVGAFVLIVSILGFVGALMQNVILLGIYIGLLSVICAVEVAGGIVAIVYLDKIKFNIEESLAESLQGTASWTSPYYKYNASGEGKCMSSGVGALWDKVQDSFDCCGVRKAPLSGYESSNVTLSKICPTLKLTQNKPITCCRRIDRSDSYEFDHKDQVKSQAGFDCRHIKSRGCSEKLGVWLEATAPVIIGIGIGIGMMQLLVILFAICLCQNAKSD